MRDPFIDDFFKDADERFNRDAKKGLAGIIGAGCLIVLVNAVISLALLAGAVWVVVSVLRHFNVI